MPFTEEQKRKALLDNGYDPASHDVDDQGYVVPRATPVAPVVSATEINHEPPQTSAKGAFGRAGLASLGPALIGLGTSAATLGAAETATGVGAPVGIPTLVVSGLLGAVGSYLASKGQEAVMPDEWKKQLAVDAEQHPIASGLGSLAPNLAAFRVNSPGNLVKAARGFIPGQIDDAARIAAKDMAINTGINLGVGAGMRKMEGGEALDPAGIGWDLAGSLAFGQARNNKLTRALKLHSGEPDYNLGDIVDAAQRDTRPAFEPEAPAQTLRTWDPEIHGVEKELKAARKAVAEKLKGQKVPDDVYESLLVDASDELRASGKLKSAPDPVVTKIQNEIKAREEAKKFAEQEQKAAEEEAKRQAKAKAQFLSPEEAAIQNSALEQERIKTEGIARNRERIQAEVEAENAALAQEEAIAKAQRDAELAQRKQEAEDRRLFLERQRAEEEARMAEAERIRQKNIAESIDNPAKSKIRDVPEWMGRASESRDEAPDVAAREDSRRQSLTRGFLDIFREHFGPIHGAKIEKGTGEPGVKGFVKNGEATVTPAATQDTPAHELFGHAFIDKALGDPRGEKVVGQLLRSIESSPDYARWKAEAETTGTVDPSAKEYAAQLLGQRLAGDLSGNKYKTTDAVGYQLNLLKRELKRMFGRATQDDLEELTQNAYVMGSSMRGVPTGNTDFQHDRSDKDVRNAKQLFLNKDLNDERFPAAAQKVYDEAEKKPLLSSDKYKLNAFERQGQDKLDIRNYDFEQASKGLVSSDKNLTADSVIAARKELNKQASEAGFIPVPVWHGTKNFFESFSKDKAGSATKSDSAKVAWFFSSSRFDSSQYGKEAPYYINPGKVKVLDMRGRSWSLSDTPLTALLEKGFNEGYDTVVLKNFRDPGDVAGLPTTHYAMRLGREENIKRADLNATAVKETSEINAELSRLIKARESAGTELARLAAKSSIFNRGKIKAKEADIEDILTSENNLRSKLLNTDYQLDNKGRFNTGSANVFYSREDVPEVPFKSNIARMVQGMKQERFTKAQLEAEIRKNKSTTEEYDYRGLSKTLPEKLDKATVLKAVEGVAPKIERVNYTDKAKLEDDAFAASGTTRGELISLLTPEAQKSYQRDPARWEAKLKTAASELAATKASGFIDTGSNEITRLYLVKQGLISDISDSVIRAYNKETFKDDDSINAAVRVFDRNYLRYASENKGNLHYDPNVNEQLKRYWTSNPNRSETTLKIPSADYVGRPRSREHFSNDTFGWIRTSEGEAGGVPTKIGEEAQSDVTKDFRKRTERDEELIRRGTSALDLKPLLGPKGNRLLNQKNVEQLKNIKNFRDNVESRGNQTTEETLTTTPYLNSERRLLLKQLILEAERDGFRKIAWTTGDEQARRNGRDVIEGGRVEWKVEPTKAGKNNGYVSFSAAGRNNLLGYPLTGLRDLVNTANKPDQVLIESAGLKAKHIDEILARIKRGETSGSYEAISGEGYKNIYDREDVKEARRLGLDPKLEKMSDGVTRWTAEITPKASEEARYAFSREDAPVVGSGLSRIRELGPGGEYLAEKLKTNAEDQQLLNGRFRNPVSEVLREFSNEDATKIDALVSQEGGFIPPKFKKAVATIKKVLQDTHDEQRARGLPVKYLDEKGNTHVRPPKDKPGYNPSVVGTHVYDQLINTPETPEASALRKDFVDYFTAEFSEAKDPKAKAEERLRQMFPRKGGGVGVDYNAVRLAEGHGLPESWKEKNIANKWYRYLSKFNADLAYFKNLQSDPAVRQLLNINEDGKTVGVAERADTLPDGTDIKHVNYESNPHVIGALHDAVGGRQLLPSQMLSYSKLANAVTLGPVGKVRDLATVVPIAMELVGPWEVIKALPKAVMSTAEGIAKAKERGIINTRSATWHENLDNLDTMVDRAADTINHYTGAQKLEQIARGFSWSLGKAIAEANIDNPSFVKKFGGKKDVESLADRITENIQGTYDFRGTPTWIRESSFGPLFALNRWSIERFNNWKRNVFDEARDGNLKPLLGNMFGVLLGSALVDELNETIRGKKPDHLSWSEWLALDGEDSAYKLAAALSTSSTTGVLGDIVYSAHQLAAGKPPRGTGMPMLEIASNAMERLGQMVQAGSLDFPQLALQLAKDNIQLVRDLAPVDPKAAERRDVRVYKRVVEETPQPFINTNPFERANEKALREASPEEFVTLLPKVVSEILKNSKNPAKDIEGLKRSLSRGDNSFVEDNRFYQMLVKLRGKDEADRRLVEYLKDKDIRAAKGGVL